MPEDIIDSKPLEKGGVTNEKQSSSKNRTKNRSKANESVKHSKQDSHATNAKNGQPDGSPDGLESTKMDPAQEVAYQVGFETIQVPSEVDITPFVTNPEGNVYAITNLPEEFIAVLFAWVSRSPKSFKDQLRTALQEGHIQAADIPAFEALDEKARAFHEKWTVNYGHSSVAEHATTHVGIEKVSRLASAELELSNEFYSITEYSQRYQKPERGNWYNPFECAPDNEGWGLYNGFMHECFDVFEKLIDGVYQHLKEKDKGNLIPASVTVQMNRDNALRKLAFEDARYALPLAMYSQLGMTANGRAWRDGISSLYDSNYSEVHKLADDLKKEISKVLPTLLKHATASKYKERSNKRVRHHFARKVTMADQMTKARLIHYSNEEEAINQIIAMLFVKIQGLSYSEGMERAKHMTWDRRSEIIQDMIFEMNSFDTPPEEFKYVNYKAELLISEANWHQLLRHNRKTNFVFNEPTPYHGITIPPRVKEAGLEHLLINLAVKSQELFEILGDGAAGYVVLNAHRRRVIAQFNLWEAYHLINLRTSDHAQWDIKETFNELYNHLSFLHPRLIQYAKRR